MATNGTALALEEVSRPNLEAEQFELGSVLLDDTLFPQVAGVVDAGDFNVEKHRRTSCVWRTCRRGGERIEYLTLVNELEKHTQLESVDGIAYVLR